MRIFFGIISILGFLFVGILALKILFVVMAILLLPYPLFTVLPFVFMYDNVFNDGKKLTLTIIAVVLIAVVYLLKPYFRK